MELDATFWATVALILFFVLIAYLKVPGMMTAGLDKRADGIRNDLDHLAFHMIPYPYPNVLLQ